MAAPIVPNPACTPPGLAGAPPARTPERSPTVGPPFREILQGKLDATRPLHFSNYALERLERRNIALDATVLPRLQEGLSRLQAKGGRESLVLVDGTAFVVSVPNRTVITAVDREHMRQQVFTNIDSAVIA